MRDLYLLVFSLFVGCALLSNTASSSLLSSLQLGGVTEDSNSGESDFVFSLEEFEALNYEVKINSEPLKEGEGVNDELNKGDKDGSVGRFDRISMFSKKGQEFSCLLPGEEFVSNSIDSMIKKNENRTEGMDPESILSSLGCLHTTVQWWTYYVCVGREIAQLHLEPKETIEEKIKDPDNVYSLGHYDAEASSERNIENQLEPASRVYSQIFKSGTFCDSAQKLRETHVMFLCDEKSPTHIAKVFEDKPCVYEIIIVTPELCKNERYRERLLDEPDTTGTIECSPVLNEALYKKYLEKKKKEEALGRGKLSSIGLGGLNGKARIIDLSHSKEISSMIDYIAGADDSDNSDEGGDQDKKAKAGVVRNLAEIIEKTKAQLQKEIGLLSKEVMKASEDYKSKKAAMLKEGIEEENSEDSNAFDISLKDVAEDIKQMVEDDAFDFFEDEEVKSTLQTENGEKTAIVEKPNEPLSDPEKPDLVGELMKVFAPLAAQKKGKKIHALGGMSDFFRSVNTQKQEFTKAESFEDIVGIQKAGGDKKGKKPVMKAYVLDLSSKEPKMVELGDGSFDYSLILNQLSSDKSEGTNAENILGSLWGKGTTESAKHQESEDNYNFEIGDE
eukprot:Nk52_evm80s207 gene=Nk52_evmTU80s207